MRRVRFGANSLFLATAFASPSSPATALRYASLRPLISFTCLKPHHLITLASSHGFRSISISAPSSCSSAFPLLPLPENDDLPDFERGESYQNPKSSKVLLKVMNYGELQEWVQSHRFRPGQALMLWKRLYGDNIWAHNIDELEGLNKDFKKMLSEHAEFRAFSFKDIRTASDGTRKEVADFVRAGRRVEQAVYAWRLLSVDIGSITNVVFMGMGEPFHTIENVIKASDIMVDEQGLHFSPCKVTVSTSGLVPQLKRFLHESKCALAVSLNATTDEHRGCKQINRSCEGPSCDEKMIEFRNVLAKDGCTVFMQFSRGDDQMAACGQLGTLVQFKHPCFAFQSNSGWLSTLVPVRDLLDYEQTKFCLILSQASPQTSGVGMK
ncbi:Leucine-rich repeat-containing protein 50 [Hibiscus syriacus]|uniref:Leucine-rich repeat-containing protein 50 n=1 Tax=Hibiscus syriacus TaxID=106335 RepID=A0A6A3BMA7_HIBSY|nr:Leucine-rich repeat-containing protein 50 [Hibiscus syriacus]